MALKVRLIRGDIDYFSLDIANEEETVARWHGAAARKLGLEGQRLKLDEFTNVLNGFSPDGTTKLIRNAGAANRQAAWEFVVSVDKSFEIFCCCKEDQRKAVETAIEHSLQKTILDVIENDLTHSRYGKGGTTGLEQSKPVICVFPHKENRDGEIFTHWHILAINTALTRDQFKTVVSQVYYDNQNNLHARFQKDIADTFQHKLQLPIKNRYGLAALDGVPDELVGEFSQRSARIKEAYRERGRKGPKAKLAAVYGTRKKKEFIPLVERMKQWKAKVTAFGMEKIRVIKRVIPTHWLSERFQRFEAGRAIKSATRVLAREHGGFNEKSLAAAGLTLCIGKSPPEKIIDEEVARRLRDPKKYRLITVNGGDGKSFFTTKRQARRDQRIKDYLDRLATVSKHKVRAGTFRSVLVEGTLLSRRAIKDLQAQTGACGISVFRGQMEGARRRFSNKRGDNNAEFEESLRLLAEMYEKKGYQVFGVAKTGRQAAIFQKGTGIWSFTVRDVKNGLARPSHWRALMEGLNAKHRRPGVKSFLEAAEKRRLPTKEIGRKTVVVVRESESIAPEKLHLLIRRVAKRRGKLILLDEGTRGCRLSVLALHEGTFSHVQSRRPPEQERRMAP